MNIDIENDSCIKCGRCVKVCPTVIFGQETAKSEVDIHHIETCISCGHCVSVCPTGSVIHSDFPPQKVHKIDADLLASPEQVMALIKSRRSYRAFSKQAIPIEVLEQILEAAHSAPTAENLQQVQFTLVTDPEVLHKVSAATISIFSSIVTKVYNPLIKPLVKLVNPEGYKQVSHLRDLVDDFTNAKKDRILRGSTALILIHTPKDVRFGRQDANLAYQNGSLMAESLGVGQFYTGFICAASDMVKKSPVAKLLNIEGTIHAGMALGMPTFEYPNYVNKKDIVITRF
ncbi:nitroreductase family protein [Dysgonomonas sp. Marseille-P4677]|nr:nitroreductase family protein [Dysgonomonas sp. Marseille-P4677]